MNDKILFSCPPGIIPFIINDTSIQPDFFILNNNDNNTVLE